MSRKLNLDRSGDIKSDKSESEFLFVESFVMGTVKKPFLGLGFKIDSLNNIIDGGKKECLLNLIASAPTTTSTRNELSAYSPYLSDEVLEAYMS